MSQLRTDSSRSRHLFIAAAALILSLQTACVRQVVAPSAVATIAPALSVERFLQASQARDFAAMSRIFGTPDGPVANTGSTLGCAFQRVGDWFGMGDRCRNHQEVEVWMATIAEVLTHQDFKIVSERAEPGRAYPTSRVGVDITRGSTVIRDVPFMVVRNAAGAWFVQEVDLVKLTSN